MRITEIDENVVKIGDDLTIDFNSLKCNKGILDIVYDLMKKQEIAVINARTTAEATENYLFLFKKTFNRLSNLPHDFPIQDLPETVTIMTNLGNEEKSRWLAVDVEKESVIEILRDNPKFVFVDKTLQEKFLMYT